MRSPTSRSGSTSIQSGPPCGGGATMATPRRKSFVVEDRGWMSQGHQPAHRAAFTTLGNSMITTRYHRASPDTEGVAGSLLGGTVGGGAWVRFVVSGDCSRTACAPS